MTFYAFDVNSLQSPIKCYAFYWKDSIKIRTVLCNIWSSPSRNTDIHPVTQNCTRMNEIQRERYGGGGGWKERVREKWRNEWRDGENERNGGDGTREGGLKRSYKERQGTEKETERVIERDGNIDKWRVATNDNWGSPNTIAVSLVFTFTSSPWLIVNRKYIIQDWTACIFQGTDLFLIF